MQENRNYQRELAECLIKAVGLNGAMDFARTNHWEGVMTQIQCVEGRFIHEGDDVLH